MEIESPLGHDSLDQHLTARFSEPKFVFVASAGDHLLAQSVIDSLKRRGFAIYRIILEDLDDNEVQLSTRPGLFTAFSQLFVSDYTDLGQSSTIGLTTEDEDIDDDIRRLDGLIFLITESYSSDRDARLAASIAANASALIIPVVVDSATVPFAFRYIDRQDVTSGDPEFIAQVIVERYEEHVLQMIQSLQKQQRDRERIERSASKYVEDTLLSLQRRELKSRSLAILWQFLGFASLAGGAGAAYSLTSSTDYLTQIKGSDWSSMLILTTRGLIIVGLLIASAKYAFELGKSHMGEALRNANRIHAISFGRFYLGAYGEQASWADLKEVFQHWNIDKETQFSTVTADVVEPKMLEAIAEIVKNASSKS